MAVYEHTYKQYAGPLTTEWSRFLVIPRHAYRSVFQSKLFTAFFVLCFVYPLVAAILIYLHHNAQALSILQVNVRELLPIDASFFETYMKVQRPIAFFLALLIGPPLVSRDLANNALPLYLCRPFTRTEYVIGKMSVLLILLSLITWIPGLLLFVFQSYLEGAGWFTANLRIAAAIFIGSWLWIFLLSLLALAISAWLKWRMAASGALLGIFFIPAVFGEIINGLFWTRLGNLLSLNALIGAVWSGLFGTWVSETGHIRGRINGRFVEVVMREPPLWSSWVVLFVIFGLCLLLLARRIKAYEVVK